MLQKLRSGIKKCLRPLRRCWITRSRLVRDLRELGVAAGDLLLVHSSFSAIGFVPGGPTRVLEALREVLGPEGTLVLPTHSWEEMEHGQRVFDVRRTKSCVGALTEMFRSLGRVQRSLHPTHSLAAFGPLAGWLISGHENCLTPCGAGTPCAKLLERGGRILFVGTGLQSNTAFHTVEALADVSYLMREEPDLFTIVDASGQTRQKRVRRHRAGIARRFAEQEAFLVGRMIARTGRVGEAPSILLEGSLFLTCMMHTLEHQPDFLLAIAKQASAPPLPVAS